MPGGGTLEPERGQGRRGGPVVAIDASRNRSGGAKAHLLGILGAGDPRQHGIDGVHVWSYERLLGDLPDAPWLTKHGPPELDRSLLHQVLWQYRDLPRELVGAGCNLLLSTDAGTVCRFSPSVVMSRDMLSFEGQEMRRYSPVSLARLRLVLLKHMQVSSLRRAEGSIFLTRHAREVIQGFTGPLARSRVIPHGIGEAFRRPASAARVEGGTSIRCVYVSNADLYKHQWHVVRAIASLRRKGHPILLKLVGGGSGTARALLDEVLAEEDPGGTFVELLESVPHDQVPGHLAEADLFVFASSCENMPNTLVEAMASGLPIACSDRGPMPEILQDAGAYFDPEDPGSIARAIERLLLDESFRIGVARKARARSEEFSWARCARETWQFLGEVWRDHVVASRRLAPARVPTGR